MIRPRHWQINLQNSAVWYLISDPEVFLVLKSMKTIAFEISEQLTDLLGPESANNQDLTPQWRAPDWYFQSVSGALGPLGVIKGFQELTQMSLTNQSRKWG